MVLGSNWAFVIYKVFKSSNPVMFISCTYGHLDLLFFKFILLYKHFNVHDQKISVGQRQEDIRIISFEKGKGLEYSTSIAVEISNY